MTSKEKDDPPVSEKLCESRRQTIREEIDGIKKTIYVSVATATTIIVIVQFILTLVK